MTLMTLSKRAQMILTIDWTDLTPDGVGGGDVSNSVMSSVSTSNGNLVRTEKLKIIDFGLARDLGPDTDRMPINMCGTLEFMSPEVMRFVLNAERT